MSVLIYDSNADYYAAALAARAPGLEYVAAAGIEKALAAASRAEVLVALAPYVTRELLAAMPRLRWIQALTTGVDNLAGLEDVAITNCGGIHGPQMSELAVMLMLASARRFARMLENQHAHRWERWPQPLLAGKTACIIGLGSIAEHLAGLLGAMGMRVTGVSNGRREAPGLARIYPRSEITAAVSEADFVVVLTPYSAQTHHIVDGEVLSAMKGSAHLINIARGGCVDEDALAKALRDGRIAGAAIDVFATEPLPADSLLWDLPNLITTPHVGGYSDVYHEQALPIVAANMADYARGGVEALKGRLDA
jgi:D-2-hydroxyacid dehydrogenase (NADP+)